MKPKIFFILFFLQACGHSQSFIEEDTFNIAAPAPAPTPPVSQSGPCQGFIEAVFAFEAGEEAGFGQERYPEVIFGPPQGNGELRGGLDVLTLGSGGHIIVDMFPCLIVDEAGPDFIVFENAFYVGGDPENPFAELALVSASQDGTNFVDFPCEAAAYPYTGCAGWHAVLSQPDNGISPFDASAAGGDPFDLAEIGMKEARFIRIEDLFRGIGPAPKTGFDLDAIAVIHGTQGGTS